MVKKTMLAALAFVAMAAEAQKIDFNLPGKESTSTEDGFVSWSMGRTMGSQSAEFETPDGGKITIKVEAVTGEGFEGNGVNCNWWKDGVNKYSKLVSDGVYPIILDAANNYTPSTTKNMGLKFTISGLPAGNHSLSAYHNNTDGLTNPYPKLNVKVNGETVLTGVEQSIRAQSLEKAGMSHISFTAKAGEDVVIEYQTVMEEGKTYSNCYAVVNALVFDKEDPNTAAVCVMPQHLDFHYDCDATGEARLEWTAGSTAVKHQLYFGTDADNLSMLTETPATTYTTEKLSALYTYYWRVDEVDASGKVIEGDVWSFRPRHDAFPGAEGYGRYAIGGRGGTVYHVTNLSDDVDNPREGSLRYGIKNVTGPRTIVFDIGGYITLKGRLTCSDPYVTIAGQTAPGQGITLRGAPFGVASDGITRFIRSYRGYGGDANGPIEAEQNKGLDGLGMAGNDNSIMDHCSVSWTTDEAFSSRNSMGITLQRTMISEALNQADHPNYSSGNRHGYAATIGGGKDGKGAGSYHHNLLAHCEGRNWSLSGGLTGGGDYDGSIDAFNNVVYNWGSRATDGGTHMLNFVNNYYKKGPATSQNYLLRHQFEGTGNGSQAAYVKGNIREETNGTKTQDKEGNTYRYETSGGQVLSWEPWSAEPFFPSLANIESAEAAYYNVLSDVGCTLPFFNDHDKRIVRETATRTTTYKGSKTGKAGLIDREWDAEGYVTIAAKKRAADWDTDQDGMPDWWEDANGLDKAVADNNLDIDGDGYTALEDYLNWMALPHYELANGDTLQIALHDFFAGYPVDGTEYSVPSPVAGVTLDADNLTFYTANATSKLVAINVTAAYKGFSLTRTFNVFVDGPAAGDANGDGNISVADLSMIASYILGDTPEGFNQKAADVNKDGSISVADLSLIASMILEN